MGKRKGSRKKATSRGGAAPRGQRTAPRAPLLTSIVVIACDQVDYTRLCIESILANTPPDRFELIVVDNGSTDGTAQYLATVPARIVTKSSNVGIAKAWNAGARAAKGTYVAFADNDTLVSEGWLDGLLAAFADDDVWAVCPNLSRVHVPRDFARRARDMARQPAIVAESGLVGSFFVLRRRALERVGGFDESFGVGPYADLDYEFSLMAAGKAVRKVFNVCVHHFEGRTVIGVEGFFDQHEERNRRYFEAKWRLGSPLPPMKADFEFDLWLSQARDFRPPRAELIRERTTLSAGAQPAEQAARSEPRIIACFNVFNDASVLDEAIESVSEADLFVFVDGPYEGVEHAELGSSDGTLEVIEQRRLQGLDIEVITRDEPWPDEATKRSAYFVGREGDWYIQLDADERLAMLGMQGNAMSRLRAHLDGCLLDAHSLLLVNDDGRQFMFPRVFRHKDGIRYDAAHWNVVAGDEIAVPDWAAQCPLHGLAIVHLRGRRPAERLAVQDAFYTRMHAEEAARLAARVADLESRRTGDREADAPIEEMIWSYRNAALYNQQAHAMLASR